MSWVLLLGAFSLLPFHLYEETVKGKIAIPDSVLESTVDLRSVVWLEFDPEEMDSGWAIEVEVLVIHPDGSTQEVPVPYFGGVNIEGYMNKIALRPFQLRDTYIDLRKFGIREGDLLRVHVSDMRRGEFDLVRYLNVIKAGLETGVSSVFLFPFRKRENWEGEGPNGGATYWLKIHTRGRNLKEGLLNLFGFGINFSLLDFEAEKATEVGIAPVLTFFNHVFQLGFGYNLHASDDPYYFVFAFDIPQIFSILHLVSR